jgi:hypothetical protein
MKQIGVNAIADNAITTPKLADSAITTNKVANNSITTTKPNEGFMKRVTLLDNAAANALGWNPNGVTTAFTITEPAVSGVNSAYITASVQLGGAPDCRVTGQFGGGFLLVCDAPPGDFAELHYVVENLPSHVPF